VAGFRFGHSMVRSEYDYNLNFNPNGQPGTIPATLDFLFTFTALSGPLGEHRTLPDNWIIQWRKFLAPGGKNRARKLDTTITRELFHLRDLEGNEQGKPQLGEENDEANLAVRNLLRGYALRMPTGQAVADEIGLPVPDPGPAAQGGQAKREPGPGQGAGGRPVPGAHPAVVLPVGRGQTPP